MSKLQEKMSFHDPSFGLTYERRFKKSNVIMSQSRQQNPSEE